MLSIVGGIIRTGVRHDCVNYCGSFSHSPTLEVLNSNHVLKWPLINRNEKENVKISDAAICKTVGQTHAKRQKSESFIGAVSYP